MGNYGDTPVLAVENLDIFNVTMTNANEQYSLEIPNGCKTISVTIRDGVSGASYRVAYVTGKVATPTAPYLKFKCDTEYFEDGLFLNGKNLYLACSNASQVAQVVIGS
jgi:hypothetical protein